MLCEGFFRCSPACKLVLRRQLQTQVHAPLARHTLPQESPHFPYPSFTCMNFKTVLPTCISFYQLVAQVENLQVHPAQLSANAFRQSRIIKPWIYVCLT